jgi:hypothetical protein
MTTMKRTPRWIIKVYGAEHGMPHFHLLCPEGRAVVAIADGEIPAGRVPKKLLTEARAWADSHRDALFDEWGKLNPTL